MYNSTTNLSHINILRRQAGGRVYVCNMMSSDCKTKENKK